MTASGENGECVFDLAHEREGEASYFLYRMSVDYHDPRPFRCNLNAFLSALDSLGTMIRLDLERAQLGDWWANNKQDLYNDPVLKLFRGGRNYTVHRGQLLRGSQLEMGLFRGNRMKLASMEQVDHYRSSEDLLRHVVQPIWIGTFLDEEHSAIGEQLGVRRMYYINELSREHDVFTACHLAFVKASSFLDRAHEACGVTSEGPGEEWVLEARAVADFNLLVEGDIDPDAYGRWGWEDPDSLPNWMTPAHG